VTGLGSRFLMTALAALCIVGCDRPSSSGEGTGAMVAEWTGSDTGRLVAPARAEWCDSLGMLEIRAIHGDSGLAVAIYPESLVRPDSYPVRPPDSADSVPPASAVALRWFAETAIRGFQGDSGQVVLERTDGRVTGWFEAAMRSVNDDMRLDLRGSFRELRIVPAARGCVARRPAAPVLPVQPADSGVD
jgi:hypothetical protein